MSDEPATSSRYTPFGWNVSRPWWRRVLVFPFGPCECITHDPGVCAATWRRTPVERSAPSQS